MLADPGLTGDNQEQKAETPKHLGQDEHPDVFVSFRRACAGLKNFKQAGRAARFFTGRPAFFTGDEFWVSG